MGVIEEINDKAEALRTRHAEGFSVTEEARRLGASTLDGMKADLKLPDFYGDLDEALLHHMGVHAFGEPFITGTAPYLDIANGIAKRSEEERVPVLFRHDSRYGQDNELAKTSTIVDVGSNRPVFRSSFTHRKDIEWPGIDKKVSVTVRTLSLLGATYEIRGDILDPSTLEDEVTVRRQAGGLLLAKHQVIHPTNRLTAPADRTYGAAEKVFDIVRGGENPHNGALGDEVLVGWDEIAYRLAKAVSEISSEGNPRRGAQYEYLLKVGDWLNAYPRGHQMVKDYNADMARMLSLAYVFNNTVADATRYTAGDSADLP